MKMSGRRSKLAVSVFQTAVRSVVESPLLNCLNISWTKALRKILQGVFLLWQAVDQDDLISLSQS